MSDSDSEIESINELKHLSKDDLFVSKNYVMTLVNTCNDCKNLRDGLKKTIKLNLNEDTYDMVCKFFSCPKCKRISSVIENCIEWKYLSLNEIQTYYFIKFNAFPSYELLEQELNDRYVYNEQMYYNLRNLYDNLDDADYFVDFKYNCCNNDPDHLKRYFDILMVVIVYLMNHNHGRVFETYHYLYDDDFGFTLLDDINEYWFNDTDSESDSEFEYDDW